MAAAVCLLVGCGDTSSTQVVRGADDVQVLTPEEVAAARAAIDTAAPASTPPEGTDGAPATAAAADTIPVNKDDRPPELRLFDAFGKFKSCIEDKGYTIQGDLQDRSNPAYQDPAYVEAVSTCAARTDIVNILAEVQATRADLTPQQVEERNQAFIDLRDCLVDKGWTIETSTSEIGLLEPKVFQNADGVLDDRDIDQCVSELNIGEG
ncbi:MAG: hypothetical protein Q7T27_06610 [Pseudomonas sp.]|uniref:hypothetical protein n=1 Tax=Pseudomonas sp. TaxID=306 RepID=UPI002728328F|nr:hypothetical protein [Pseudomonas sp.]MDO8403151.1 hypothetical protein [Pseudomonas sp.]